MNETIDRRKNMDAKIDFIENKVFNTNENGTQSREMHVGHGDDALNTKLDADSETIDKHNLNCDFDADDYNFLNNDAVNDADYSENCNRLRQNHNLDCVCR